MIDVFFYTEIAMVQGRILEKINFSQNECWLSITNIALHLILTFCTAVPISGDCSRCPIDRGY